MDVRKGTGMSKFIKIGNRIINLDLITDIRVESDNSRLTVYFAASGSSSLGTHFVSFTGDEANTLRWLMDSIALDVIKRRSQSER